MWFAWCACLTNHRFHKLHFWVQFQPKRFLLKATTNSPEDPNGQSSWAVLPNLALFHQMPSANALGQDVFITKTRHSELKKKHVWHTRYTNTEHRHYAIHYVGEDWKPGTKSGYPSDCGMVREGANYEITLTCKPLSFAPWCTNRLGNSKFLKNIKQANSFILPIPQTIPPSLTR